MARVKLSIPETYIFQNTIKVRISDLNYGGHTGNDTILKYMHETRMNFLASLGIKSEISVDGNVGIIVADAAIEYKSETFFNDSIKIFVAIGEFHKYGFDMFYHLIKEDKKEVARGKTAIVFFDYSTRKITRAPEELMKKIIGLPDLEII